MPTTRAAALLLAGALLLSACTATVDGAPVPVPRPTRPKPPPSFVLLVPAGQNDMTRLTVQGVEKYASETKGKLTQVTLTGRFSDDRHMVMGAIAQNPTVVITLRANPEIMLQQIQARPGQQFLRVDDVCEPNNAKNVTCLEFREHEGAYLLGVEAGLLSPTGKLGAVASMDIPILKRFYVPIGQGAAAVKPGAESSQCTVVGRKDVLDKVREVRDKIISGELQVEDPSIR